MASFSPGRAAKSYRCRLGAWPQLRRAGNDPGRGLATPRRGCNHWLPHTLIRWDALAAVADVVYRLSFFRSEARRVGKEGGAGSEVLVLSRLYLGQSRACICT